MTVRRYVDILEGTFMIRLLQPWHVNIGKRLVKSPKLYFHDSGLFQFFQGITTKNELASNPKLGASFEGFALDVLVRKLALGEKSFCFYRTQAGAELDLFWRANGKNYGIEIIYADAPTMTKSMHAVIHGDTEGSEKRGRVGFLNVLAPMS